MVFYKDFLHVIRSSKGLAKVTKITQEMGIDSNRNWKCGRIRYNPSNIATSKIVSNLDNRGITVTYEHEQNPSADSKTTISSNSSIPKYSCSKINHLGSIKAAKAFTLDMEYGTKVQNTRIKGYQIQYSTNKKIQKSKTKR